MSDAVESIGVPTLVEVRRIVKRGLVWIQALSGLGLIIGLIIGIAGGIDEGGYAAAALFGLVGAWIGAGLGCSLRGFLSLPSLCWSIFKQNIKEHGLNSYGLKEGLGAGVVGCLILGSIFYFVGAFTGPIIPLVYILKRKKQLKSIDPMIERCNKICATLRNAHTKPDDPATQAEIDQGSVMFAVDMRETARIEKPILWFLK
jgi:hypothetical protein